MIVSNMSWFYFLVATGLATPFIIFACSNIYQALQRRNFLAVLYWILNMGYITVIVCVPAVISFSGPFIDLEPKHIVALIAISSVIGALYGISLFVFWWLRPGFYYRWDEGRRKQA
jgi:predicted membrane protein